MWTILTDSEIEFQSIWYTGRHYKGFGDVVRHFGEGHWNINDDIISSSVFRDNVLEAVFVPNEQRNAWYLWWPI
jgi:hypothetical protein